MGGGSGEQQTAPVEGGVVPVERLKVRMGVYRQTVII